jgi:hypothetical protein
VILVVNGPLGVGKTETSWALLHALGRSALVDGDYAASERPFDFSDPAHLERARAALLALARHHHEAGVPHLVVNWVFETPEQLAALVAELEPLQRPVHCYRLTCDPEEHEARIRARGLGRSAAEVRAELERGRELAGILDGVAGRAALGHPVDTTRKWVAAVAEEILRHAASTVASGGDGQ